MQYIVDFDIREFPFWSGAAAHFKEVVAQGRIDELNGLIEERFQMSTPTKTEINDFVWHTAPDYMDLYKDNDDEENEEDEEFEEYLDDEDDAEFVNFSDKMSHLFKCR